MKNAIKLSGIVSGYNEPKYELNYSLLSEKRLVSTDAWRMLIVEDVCETNSENMLLQTGKIKVTPTTPQMTCISLGVPSVIEKSIGKYPQYQRIVFDTSTLNMVELNNDIQRDLQTMYKKVCFNYKFIEDLFKCKATLTGFYFQDVNLPFMIVGKIDGHDFKYVVMPIVT